MMMRKMIVIVALLAASPMVTCENATFLVIDVQNCFTSGGTLEVQGGDAVIPVINQILEEHREQFSMVVFSQDWHCSNHISFASQHPGNEPYDIVPLIYDSEGDLCNRPINDSAKLNESMCEMPRVVVNQTLWPDHCVINTTDAAYRQDLDRQPEDLVFQKGYNCDLDSYSVFSDNGGFSLTGFHEILQDQDIDTLYIAGLALDYCVYWTAKDAVKLNYDTFVVVDATRPVDNSTGEAALKDMEELGKLT